MYFRGTAIGRLTKDPELRKTKTDKSVCNFYIAINNPYSDNDDDTQFIKVTLWNKQAEAAKRNLNKGRLVMVEGEISLSEFKSNKTDETYSDIVITANNIRYLDYPKDGSHKEISEKNYQPEKKEFKEDEPSDFNTEDYSSDEDAYDFNVPF